MEVKWIKLTTDMFDNRKIRHLRKLPDGNSIVLIWVMLLTMAGRCNAGGMIFLTENIPYTNKMLADELDFEENTVHLALSSLEQLGMIQLDPLRVSNWEEYQNIDRMEEIREYNRLAQQKSRERKRLKAAESNVNDNVNDLSMTSQRCHETEEDIDIDIDIRKEKVKKEKKIDSPPRDPVLAVFEKFAGDDDALALALHGFAEMRKSIKKPLTENAAVLICKKLEKFPMSDWIEIVNQSTMNSWQGIFPLDGRNQKQGRAAAESSVDRMARLAREGVFDE